MKNITITVSSYYKPKKWEVIKIATSKQWTIVYDIKNKDGGFTLDTTPIRLSKWKWIRNFQIWMIGKIFIKSES